MQNTVIDLRSDTVTRPSPAMLEAMMNAEVGDDVFSDDPTVNRLEAMIARMFGKETAVFCPSGTMTNQIAIKTHTQPGDEIICDITSHVYNFEGGGIGFNSGCSVRLVHGDLGRMKASQVKDCMNPDNVHYAKTRLVVAENTCNKGGGSIYDMHDIEEIGQVCKQYNLKYHLDGARIFNALVETGESPEDYGKLFDSISICFSKGLGAPVGSALLGDQEFITRARRIRKVFGGSMRQAGYLAAAAIFALENNIPLLKEDHRRAKELGNFLHHLHFVADIVPVQSNMLIFKLRQEFPVDNFIEKARYKGLLFLGFGPQTVRMVTHMDFNDQMLQRTYEILGSLE